MVLYSCDVLLAISTVSVLLWFVPTIMLSRVLSTKGNVSVVAHCMWVELHHIFGIVPHCVYSHTASFVSSGCITLYAWGEMYMYHQYS